MPCCSSIQQNGFKKQTWPSQASIKRSASDTAEAVFFESALLSQSSIKMPASNAHAAEALLFESVFVACACIDPKFLFCKDEAVGVALRKAFVAYTRRERVSHKYLHFTFVVTCKLPASLI
jgi:hypothetical protein